MGRQLYEENIGKQGLFSEVCTGPFWCWLPIFSCTETPPGNGICGVPRFSEVCTLSQITALTRHLSASVDIQWPLNGNNPYVKVVWLGAAYYDSLHHFE